MGFVLVAALLWVGLFREGRREQRIARARSAVYIPYIVDYAFTDYFERAVLRKRPYLTKEMCIRTIETAIRSEPQEQNRFRF